MLSSYFFRKFFFLFITIHASVFAWNVSSNHLSKKAQQHPPLWMEERIHRDFSLFTTGFSSTDITVCLEALKKTPGTEKSGLVRICFTKNEKKCDPLFPLTPSEQTSLNSFLAALNLLDHILPLPKLDFILCLNSHFDRPSLLKETTVPLFAVSKEHHNHKVILIPRLWKCDREKLFKPLVYKWNKKIEKAFWRGSGSDEPYAFYDWDCKPRARLSLRAKHHQDLIDAALVKSSHTDALTDLLEKRLLFSSFVSPQKQTHYKYLLSLDGSASPSSFEWQLFTGSLIFKTESNHIEWFYDALCPGVHFIQFQTNGNDLIEKIQWAKLNEGNAQFIAANGLDFATRHLLDEDAFLYLYHVLKTYAHLMKK